MLKLVVIAIAKDMRFSWLEKWPDFWPEDIPFIPPRQVPEIFKALGAAHWGRSLQLLTGHVALWVENEKTIPLLSPIPPAPPRQEPQLSSTLLSPIPPAPPWQEPPQLSFILLSPIPPAPPRQEPQLPFTLLSPKGVRPFLGMTGYYRRLLHEFTTIAAPLTDLVCKNCPNNLKWTRQCEEAFDQLKTFLCSKPRSQDFSKQFHRTNRCFRSWGWYCIESVRWWRERPLQCVLQPQVAAMGGKIFNNWEALSCH